MCRPPPPPPPSRETIRVLRGWESFQGWLRINTSPSLPPPVHFHPPSPPLPSFIVYLTSRSQLSPPRPADLFQMLNNCLNMGFLFVMHSCWWCRHWLRALSAQHESTEWRLMAMSAPLPSLDFFKPVGERKKKKKRTQSRPRMRANVRPSVGIKLEENNY